MGAKGEGQGRRLVWNMLSMYSYEALRRLHPEVGKRFEGKDVSGHNRAAKAEKLAAAGMRARAHNTALGQGGYAPGAAIAATGRGGRGTRLLY